MIDLSPKIFKLVSIISIITIMINIIIDIVYVGRIDSKALVPSVVLFIFSEHFRMKSSN